MKWRAGATPRQAPNAQIYDPQRLETRLAELESQLDNSRREIAILKVALSSANARINAAVDLYEQRMDLIYRQITSALGRALADGAIKIETEAEIDQRLAKMLSAGLRTPLDLTTLNYANIVSDELTPGTLNAPLTIYGFRINRDRAREFGDYIEIMPANETSPGTAVYGPYKRLEPGTYEVTAHLRAIGKPHRISDAEDVALDVYGNGIVLADRSIAGKSLQSENRLSLVFHWTPECANGAVEFRLHQRSNTPISLTAISLEKK